MVDRKKPEKKPKQRPGKAKKRSSLGSALRDMAFPMRAFKPRTMVGIDLGSGAVKAVKLAVGNGGYRVLDWSIQPSGPARRDGERGTLRQALTEAISEVGGPGDYLAINLSGPEARIHQFSLPDLPENDLAKAVEWQVGKDLGDDATEVGVGFTILGHAPEAQDKPLEILAASAPKSVLDDLLDTLEDFNVHRVGTTALSYGSFLGTIPEGKTQRGFAVVDVGGDGTWICIFRRGTLVYARRVGVAGNLFTQSLTQPVQTPDGPLRYSAEEAEKVKREKVINLKDPAGPGKTPDYFSVLLRPAVERLSAEVERTLIHFVGAHSGDPIERVYLAGGGALIGGLAASMSGRLDLPVELLDLKRFPVDDKSAFKPMEEQAPRLAAAIGAAVGWSDDINLVPVTRRITRSGALMQGIAFWAAAALLASIPALTAITHLAAGTLTVDLAQARARFSTVGPQQIQLNEINENRCRVESMRALVSLLPGGHTVPSQILKELPGRLPKGVVLNSLYLDDGSIEVEQGAEAPARQILLSGEIHGPGEGLEATLLDFLLNIRKSPFFDAPVVTRKKRIFRGDEGALEFEIVCALN